jgi:peptidyl-prolyl cis-trans isomerase SurA
VLILARKYRSSLASLFFAFILTLMLAGCPGRGSDKEVMAKVNSYKISRSELDKNYNSRVAGAPQKPTATEEEALRLNILSQIIDMQLHLQKAEKLGIIATDDEVESKFTQAKAPYTQEEFQKRLKDLGMTEEDSKQEIRRNLTIDKLLNKEIGSKVTISDSDLQNYYNQHKADFNLIEPRYVVAHIQVTSQPMGQPGESAMKAKNDAEAHKKISEAYHRLESGEDFAGVAARFSEDPDTARNGGELGPMPESQLKNTDPATRDAILKLKPGQFSEIVTVVNPATHQPYLYRIVKLIGKETAGQRDLNDPQVQQFIRNQLRSQREQILRAAYDEVLRDNAEVHNYFAEQLLKNTGTK